MVGDQDPPERAGTHDAHIRTPCVRGGRRIGLHALDDPGPPYEAAVRLARRMPIAKVVTVECGGHLMLGDHQATFTEARLLDLVTESGGIRRNS